MASKVEIVTVAVSVTVAVPQTEVEQHTGCLPWAIGDNMAGAVDEWVAENSLGYYPAIDYFRILPQVMEPELLETVAEIISFCIGYTRRELQHCLATIFAQVEIERIQPIAYTMPRVRPGVSGAPDMLAQHYRPNILKVDLLLDAIQTDMFNALEEQALNRLFKAGRGLFESFRINAARRL